MLGSMWTLNRYLKPFDREIIFEVFQPMWSRYLNVRDGQTDGQTYDVLWYNRALRSIARNKLLTKIFITISQIPANDRHSMWPNFAVTQICIRLTKVTNKKLSCCREDNASAKHVTQFKISEKWRCIKWKITNFCFFIPVFRHLCENSCKHHMLRNYSSLTTFLSLIVLKL